MEAYCKRRGRGQGEGGARQSEPARGGSGGVADTGSREIYSAEGAGFLAATQAGAAAGGAERQAEQHLHAVLAIEDEYLGGCPA